MKGEHVSMQIRMPLEWDGELSRMSKELGISKNAVMLVLMRLGQRLFRYE